uniref:Tetraspanin 31 n=1 Tax=Scleropages formosus TaxID=113540 RepID=A0A8C9RB26_SCLFO
MVCGGFTCSKNALCSLNVVYMMVGLLLIGVAAWGKGFGIVSSIHIIGGVIAVGVFLLLIAIVGLIGALNHHQVLLFFYMVILFFVFLFQFGVSCSCLAMNREQQEKLLNSTWRMTSDVTKENLEKQLDCCGLLNSTLDQPQFDSDFQRCKAPCKAKGQCYTCGNVMLEHSAEALKILGGVGLFFSFTEILGVWLAVRYRNQKDPRANPNPAQSHKDHSRGPSLIMSGSCRMQHIETSPS